MSKICFVLFQQYASTQYDIDASCKDEVLSLLMTIQKKATIYDHDPEAALNMEQNAHIAVNAEAYYTNMLSFNDNTWNMRDSHMMHTLLRLIEFHGDDSKVIVWNITPTLGMHAIGDGSAKSQLRKF